jgi:hypothetical protein
MGWEECEREMDKKYKRVRARQTLCLDPLIHRMSAIFQSPPSGPPAKVPTLFRAKPGKVDNLSRTLHAC